MMKSHSKTPRSLREPFICLIELGVEGWLCPMGSDLFMCEACIFKPTDCVQSLGPVQEAPFQTQKNLVTRLRKHNVLLDMDLDKADKRRLKKLARRNMKDAWDEDRSWTPVDKYLE